MCPLGWLILHPSRFSTTPQSTFQLWQLNSLGQHSLFRCACVDLSRSPLLFRRFPVRHFLGALFLSTILGGHFWIALLFTSDWGSTIFEHFSKTEHSFYSSFRHSENQMFQNHQVQIRDLPKLVQTVLWVREACTQMCGLESIQSQRDYQGRYFFSRHV